MVTGADQPVERAAEAPSVSRAASRELGAAPAARTPATVGRKARGGRAPDAKARRLRVMLVTTDVWLGGAEVQVIALARALMARGHLVQGVSLQDPDDAWPLVPRGGVPFSSLHMRQGRPDPRGLLRFAREVRRFRPHVVHSHMVHANLLARAARLLAPIPVQVSTAHSIWEGPRWREIAYRLTDPLCDLTTNVTQAGVDRYVRVGAVPDGKVRHLPNGLDTSAYTPDPEVRDRVRSRLGVGESFLWLAAGTLVPPKDYPTLLEAAARLRVRNPGFVLAIAGHGPQHDSLAETQHALGLADGTVRFLGSRSDVPDLMRAADGYVMSSAYEGLPMVLLEASAAELPIVATDVGGNAEVVRSGESGLIVGAGDPEELALAMDRVMRMPPEERRAWGRTARKFVTERYDVEVVADRWLRLYRELLSPRRRTELAASH